ncbi:MAG: hypothetical protein Kow0020_15740 [Wenzhouxiangellaceae bacterium]
MRSRPVQSAQTGPHPDLPRLVRRRLAHDWLQPCHPGSLAEFHRFLGLWDARRPLVLDSGCGTGWFTATLAERHPDAQVIGVDRSAARLSRAPRTMPPNAALFRARLEDFWRLLLRNGIHPVWHALYYPNPWPKPSHLARRWHAHPVFPALIRLGGRIEVRSNWRVYLQEFAWSAAMLGAVVQPVVECWPEPAQTPFERKYAASGHRLYRLLVSTQAALRMNHTIRN